MDWNSHFAQGCGLQQFTADPRTHICRGYRMLLQSGSHKLFFARWPVVTGLEFQVPLIQLSHNFQVLIVCPQKHVGAGVVRGVIFFQVILTASGDEFDKLKVDTHLCNLCKLRDTSFTTGWIEQDTHFCSTRRNSSRNRNREEFGISFCSPITADLHLSPKKPRGDRMSQTKTIFRYLYEVLRHFLCSRICQSKTAFFD